MIISQRNYILLTCFILCSFFLLFPRVSGAISYTTGCGETINIGTSWETCCAYTCCGWDEEGNCTVTCCVSSCTQYSCIGSWDEYLSESTNCGTKILKRHCQSVCGPASNCCGCGPCQVTCSTPEVYEICKNWQKSKRTCDVTQWGLTKPECKCDGECLETPKNPRYYNNPNYPTDPTNPETGKSSTSVLLPVKLDWDDVQYWQASPDGPQSYVIRIGNTTNDPFSSTIKKSEFIPTSCLLKSNATHDWYVKACCTNSGGNCGSESSWSFSTSLAPELVSPADPDWEWKDSQGASNVSIPVKFKWCPVKDAESYALFIYRKRLEIEEEELLIPTGVTRREGVLPTEMDVDGFALLTGTLTYHWETATCFNGDTSKCGKNCGNNEDVRVCADFSQRWTLTTEEIVIDPPGLFKPFYDPSKPSEITAVNLLDSLYWERTESQGRWSGSYFYVIRKGGAEIVGPRLTRSYTIPFSQIWDFLEFDQIYNWQVKSCYGENGEEPCSDFSQAWYFKTTGAPPTQLNSDATIIPVKLDWEDVPGALSYKYKVIDVATNEIVAEGKISSLHKEPPASEILIDYPNLKQEKTYSWQIKTCADTQGEEKYCGIWSNLSSFLTFTLGIPSNPKPEDGGDFFTYEHIISSNPVPGAKAYQYKVNYLQASADEKEENCLSLAGSEVIPQTIVFSNSSFLDLKCLGEYQWSFRACLDKECNETSGWSDFWHFNFLQPPLPEEKGLIPCGRSYDFPDTPWNEREPCQFEHIFILLKNILDLLLWRIGLIILVLLAIATGVIYYFSMGAPTTMAQVKSILKSAGIGYTIIFLAWIILNLILAILGYQTGIFGRWWQIIF
jgi:hypothetical protein